MLQYPAFIKFSEAASQATIAVGLTAYVKAKSANHWGLLFYREPDEERGALPDSISSWMGEKVLPRAELSTDDIQSIKKVVAAVRKEFPNLLFVRNPRRWILVAKNRCAYYDVFR